MPERRFCVSGCGNELGKLQRGGTRCQACRRKDRRKIRSAKRDQRTALEQIQGVVRLHFCIAGEWDNFDAHRCQCKKVLSKQEVRDMFAENIVRNIHPDSRHGDCWDGQSEVFLIHKLKQSPRVQTLESAHIERGIEQAWDHRGKSQLQLESDHQSLQRRITEDKLEKCEEERVRWDIWDQLQNDWLRSITVEVPEAEWIASEKAARGDLACRTLLHVEERSSAGTNYHRSQSLESIEDQDDETATTTNTESAEDLHTATFDDDSTTDKEINYRSLEDLSEDMAEAA